MKTISQLRTLADRLTWARTEMKISQEVLAQKAKVSQGTIGNLESGSRKTARRITAIASALNVDANWLAEGKGNPFEADGGIQVDLAVANQDIVNATPDSPAMDRPQLTLAMPDELALLEMYRLADALGRKAIVAAARRAAKRDIADVLRHQN